MMALLRVTLTLTVLIGALSAVPAHAQAETYAGTATGTGAGRCTSYRMAIDVERAGNVVKGQFQQEGRPLREFQATLDSAGAFKTETAVGGGGTMSVSGMLRPDGGAILLNGYCRFETTLNRR